MMDFVVTFLTNNECLPVLTDHHFFPFFFAAEVPRIRFHDLRHTVASLMLSKNVNPKVVKEILGHSDIRVTLDTYSHVLPSVHKETATQYGEMLFG
ncbi:hypothetical protein AK95_15165 [Paenibacillus sp. LC231]|nr:hypothetical protein AK95_15165 [Paenibacillus sp. LC231]